MRVAMVSEHASPLAALGGVDAGGQNVHVASLANAMARAGVEVSVYTRLDDAALPKTVRLSPGVSVEHCRAGPARRISKDLLLPHMGALARQLRMAWSRARPDVVHAHFWMSGRASLAAAMPLEIPVVQTFHALGVVKQRNQGDRDTSPSERLQEESRIVATCDGIIATCSDELFELVRLGADPRRISVIPCGVDLDLFRLDGPAMRRTPGLQRVVVVSRLVERKGIGNLITALAGVPGCELVVAGGPEPAHLDSDPEVQRFRRLANEARVADRVRFLGSLARTQVAEVIRSADVVACVPWYEPFGMVALEAMACGVPVLATAVGGLVDTVLDGITGVHVPPRRPQELAQALRALLQDEGLRRRLGMAGGQRARRRYSWDRVAESTLDCYASVAADRAVAAGAQR